MTPLRSVGNIGMIFHLRRRENIKRLMDRIEKLEEESKGEQ